MFLLATNHILQLDVQFLNFAVGVLIPLLVGLLTKLEAPSGLKAVLNLALSAVGGALATAIAAEGNVVLEEWVVGIGMTWLASIVSYSGLWVPTGAAPKVQEATRDFGIGSTRTQPDAA